MFLLDFAPGTVGRVARLSIDFSIVTRLMPKFPSSLRSSIVSIQVLGSRIEDTVPILQAKFDTRFLALPPPSTIDPIWKLLGAWAIIQDHVREDGKALTQAEEQCGRIHRIAQCSRSSCARTLSAWVAQWKEPLQRWMAPVQEQTDLLYARTSMQGRAFINAHYWDPKETTRKVMPKNPPPGTFRHNIFGERGSGLSGCRWRARSSRSAGEGLIMP